MIDFAHVIRTYLVLTAISHRWPDADDLAQDIMVNLLRRGATISYGRAQGYFLVTVRNQIRSAAISARRKPITKVLSEIFQDPSSKRDMARDLVLREDLRELQEKFPEEIKYLMRYGEAHSLLRPGKKPRKWATGSERVKAQRMRKKLRDARLQCNT